MKKTTQLIVALFLTIIWMITTAISIVKNKGIESDMISFFMYLTPFITFFGIIMIYHIEFKNKKKSNGNW